MNFRYEDNRIWLADEAEKVLADVTFPEINATTVDINHTFVDDSLRGQGVAGKLMAAVAAWLRTEHKQAVLTCSYAQSWFAKHPEYSDVTKTD